MKKFEYDPILIVDRINEVEKKFPVNEWKINGVAFWPFIRTSLAYTQRKDLETPAVGKKKKEARMNLLKKYAKVFLQLPVHVLGFRSKIGKAKRLFVGASTHRIKINDVVANKYFDVAIGDFNKRNDRSVILDRGTSLKKSEYPNKEVWFSLPAIYVLYEFLKRLRLTKKHKYLISLEGYDEFYQHLLDNFENAAYLKTNFSKKSIVSKMKVFHDRKEFLKRFLENSELRNVYFLCYYSSLYYPLIAACYELKINTIDVQHGGMGKGHWSYDNWSIAPAEGYAMVPRFFWNWDANSAALINAWAERTKFHRAFNQGRPWLNDYVQASDYKPAVKNYILYNLADVTIEEYVLDAIKETGSKRQWVCRMHPRMVKERNLLEQQLASNKLEAFASIEDSTQIPLADSLRYCSSFISAGSSGSVIEALQAGLIPVLVPSPGSNYYEAYIKTNEVRVLPEKNTEQLIALLEESKVEMAGGKSDNSSTAYENKFKAFERLTERLS